MKMGTEFISVPISVPLSCWTMFALALSAENACQQQSNTRYACHTQPQQQIAVIARLRYTALCVCKRRGRGRVCRNRSFIAAGVDLVPVVSSFRYSIGRPSRQTADRDALTVL